jgi:hypothetical protein
METFADRIIHFNSHIEFKGSLPPGIRIMNPFKESSEALVVSSAFYRKFYDDRNPRQLILGINPGRFGAGLTGIPFTDPKRLMSQCGISYPGEPAHEPSSVFVYDMINAYGGVEKFFSRLYIHAICPLGFTAPGKNGREINYNYYDSKELIAATYDFIIQNIRTQISFGIDTRVCFCLGKGKNEKFLKKLNESYGFFDQIVPLEHPRFIMQYKSAYKEFYMEKYLEAFEKYPLL